MAASVFCKLVKSAFMTLFWSFINVTYSLLIFCIVVIWATDNKDYETVFTIYGPLKMLFCYFKNFDYSNFKMIFAKSSRKNPPFLWQIFKVPIRFYNLTNFTILKFLTLKWRRQRSKNGSFYLSYYFGKKIRALLAFFMSDIVGNIF